MISLHFGNSWLMHHNYASVTKWVTNELIIKFLISNFRCVLYVVRFLLGNSLVSELDVVSCGAVRISGVVWPCCLPPQAWLS